jgi:cysteine-rich repeat protein
VCSKGVCGTRAAADGSACEVGGDQATCLAGTCTPRCGDGIKQQNEACDDGNTVMHDGCRNDCVAEELIGLGFTGGQCTQDADCAPAGSTCELGVDGGTCVVACRNICDDRLMPTTPTTYCISRAFYESRLGHALPAQSFTDLQKQEVCVSKCDFALFPTTGCRAGLHCEQQARPTGAPSPVVDEVCVPGAWSVGLELSADGKNVIGKKDTGPALAKPYSDLLATACDGSFGSVPASLVRGMADTWNALGASNSGLLWQRLCSRPADLDNVYDLQDQINEGHAFRLVGDRLKVHDAAAVALYGYKKGHTAKDLGPLFTSRVAVVKKGSAYFLYTDAADDHPTYDPDRGHHFALVDGAEYIPIDSELQPEVDYMPIRADGGQRKIAGWALKSIVLYLADMARTYLMAHGQPLGIGDLSLPTGGDIAGHASHDVGKDADLYLVSLPTLPDGKLDVENPKLWVSTCSGSGASLNCRYYDTFSGEFEDLSAPGHVPAATLLTELAEYACSHPGLTRFVQHDKAVLEPYKARDTGSLIFLDAIDTSDPSVNWPIHDNHVHVRW